MKCVELEDIGDDHKPVLYFEGKDKGMVLNKTNATNISLAYGDDTDRWAGEEIILFPTMVDFQGRTVEAIRVRRPAAKDAPVKPKAQPRPDPGPRDGGDPRADMDDDIPF